MAGTGGTKSVGSEGDPLHLGYSCVWWHPREQTWSYIATRLRAALGEFARVSDIEAQRSIAGKVALRALHAPWRGLPWQYSRLERMLLDRKVRRRAAQIAPQAMLGIAEANAIAKAPTFLYQDTNVAVSLAYEDRTGAPSENLLPSSRSVLERRAAEQIDRLQRARGVFSTSRWYADYLAEHCGVARDVITIAPFGINNMPATTRDPGRDPAGRLLFVGVNFPRKGGELVVEAVRRLNASGDQPVRLTVAGPRDWPLEGEPPAFVDFLGSQPPDAISHLYASHDLFVMPSRFEPFGIAFVEALAAGLPCIGRRAWAMPEIIAEGETGALIGSEDPDELATAIAALLGDSGAYRRVADARAALVDRYSWRTIAAGMVERMAALS